MFVALSGKTHPHENTQNPRSQQASGRTLAGIGDHETWHAVIDNDF
jgi:hypothetical protein